MKDAPGKHTLAVRRDPHEFRERLWVDCNGERLRLRDVIEPWQAADFAALDGGWQLAAGVEPKRPPILRAYLERPRGHSKTTDIAVMASWALYAAPKQFRGVAAAGDRDQAGLILNAIDTLRRSTPALEVLEVQRDAVVNKATGSVLTVLASDHHTSYGLLCDFILLDELTNWPASGHKFFQSLFSTAAKRPRCLLAIISNAGTEQGTSWQWTVREAARTDPTWYFSRLDGPKASWITPESLAEQERMLPPPAFRRLWLNEWTAGGDVFSLSDVLSRVDKSLGPMDGSEPGWIFVGGCDLGLTHDLSAICVLAVDAERQIVRLAHVEAFGPGLNGRCDLAAVQASIRQLDWQFRTAIWFCDNWQMELMVSQLQREGIRIYPHKFNPKNLEAMAMLLLETFRNGGIELYEDRELISDLLKLSIVQKSFGYKIESPRDASGHGDRAMALVLALRAAESMLVNYEPPPSPNLPRTIFELVERGHDF